MNTPSRESTPQIVDHQRIAALYCWQPCPTQRRTVWGNSANHCRRKRIPPARLAVRLAFRYNRWREGIQGVGTPLRVVTQLSHLFCARVRQEYDNVSTESVDRLTVDRLTVDRLTVDRLTVEQVRSEMNVWLETAGLPATARRKHFEAELEKQQYYQRRNKQARVSHTKTRISRLTAMGIDVGKIKSCIPDKQPP